jgi:hypothetical protein
MGHPSPYRDPDSRSQGSGVLLSAMAGAVLGAAGLAWWLLSEAERRRRQGRQQRMLRISRLQDGSELSEPKRPSAVGQQRDLHDKVHELNQAIDDVRRQLEAMATAR